MADDDETEGFLIPARADAIAANLVDVGHVKPSYGKIRIPAHEPFRTEVTSENWLGLQAAGWQWLTNIVWPYSGKIVEASKAKHGDDHVLIGWPRDEETKEPTEVPGMVGVYVLEKLDLSESYRRFIAEHEEKPL